MWCCNHGTSLYKCYKVELKVKVWSICSADPIIFVVCACFKCSLSVLSNLEIKINIYYIFKLSVRFTFVQLLENKCGIVYATLWLIIPQKSFKFYFQKLLIFGVLKTLHLYILLLFGNWNTYSGLLFCKEVQILLLQFDTFVTNNFTFSNTFPW
jgi:hypothetical protein